MVSDKLLEIKFVKKCLINHEIEETKKIKRLLLMLPFS